MDTIAAISTPYAIGGIATIRISGEDAVNIAAKVFRPQNENKDILKMAGYTACYGEVFNKEDKLDDGVLLVFRAPKSYTGEDVVEISVHGGLYVSKQVLRAVFENGARPAEAGEFTKRAFLNGKMTLTQAEAVADIISANGNALHKAALSARDGELYKKVSEITEIVVSICADIAAWVDYPEEDMPELTDAEISKKLIVAKNELTSLLSGYDTGIMLRQGVSTAIVGKPNAGKSTLMNLLSRTQRSLVTEIAGTTRDVVEESVRLDDDILLKLSDTAGIRQTEDIVEALGVSLAKQKMMQSELVLAVFDLSQPQTEEDFEILSQLDTASAVAVLNKQDLPQKLDTEQIEKIFPEVITISAKSGAGKAELIDAVRRIIRKKGTDLNAPLLINERQRSCVVRALSLIDEALSAVQSGITLDAIGATLDSAADELLVLTGKKATDAVVAEIFSRFCVGK